MTYPLSQSTTKKIEKWFIFSWIRFQFTWVFKLPTIKLQYIWPCLIFSNSQTEIKIYFKVRSFPNLLYTEHTANSSQSWQILYDSAPFSNSVLLPVISMNMTAVESCKKVFKKSVFTRVKIFDVIVFKYCCIFTLYAWNFFSQYRSIIHSKFLTWREVINVNAYSKLQFAPRAVQCTYMFSKEFALLLYGAGKSDTR